MIMNFQTYVMIGAAVFALALNLYMKYQDKKAGVSGTETHANDMEPAMNADAPDDEAGKVELFGRAADVTYMGVFADQD